MPRPGTFECELREKFSGVTYNRAEYCPTRMGLMDKLKGELVDIIEWIDDSRSTLAWRFPRYQNEIKNGAQLIVREGQKAVFVYRGQLADQFDPGHYELKS